MTLAEKSAWESNATAAAELREQAMALWAQARRDRRTAMYLRERL
jgi:hypothetical protein